MELSIGHLVGVGLGFPVNGNITIVYKGSVCGIAAICTEYLPVAVAAMEWVRVPVREDETMTVTVAAVVRVTIDHMQFLDGICRLV